MHILSREEAAASLAFNVSVEPYIMVRGEAVGIEEQKIYRLNQPSRRHYSNSHLSGNAITVITI